MMDLTTPQTGHDLPLFGWSGVEEPTDLGINEVAAMDPGEVEDYLDSWTPGQRVRRSVKLRILLDRLELFEDAVADLNAQLLNEEITLDEWETQMGRQVKRMHLSAYLSGRSGDWSSLTASDVQAIQDEAQRQLRYLRRWRNELAEPGKMDDVSERKMNVRGGLYGASASSSFERAYGAERGLPPNVLPAYPGDGTTKCLTRCKCRWMIRVLSKERQDFDCNWRLGASEHCQTCRDRARSWLGLRIRGGELQSDPEPIFYDR